MEPFAIVIYFKLFEHLELGLGTGLEAFTMNSFDFESVVLAFHSGVVITVVLLAHSANQLMFSELILPEFHGQITSRFQVISTNPLSIY